MTLCFGSPRRQSRPTHGLVLASLLLIWPGELIGQQDTCDYAACALRVETRGFLTRALLVQGIDGAVVGSLDPSPTLEALFQTADSAAYWYGEFARHDRSAHRLRLSALALLVGAGVALAAADDDPWIGLGMAIAGSTVNFVAIGRGRRARNSISRAIWWHNRSLSAVGGGGR